MSRKKQPINIILHPPEDQKSLDALQEITDNLFAMIIMKRLSNSDLTLEEKKYVIKQVVANLA